MPHLDDDQHVCIDDCATSHPNNPIPQEPTVIESETITELLQETSIDSSIQSQGSSSNSGNENLDTPDTQAPLEDPFDDGATHEKEDQSSEAQSVSSRRRASTILVSSNAEDVQRILCPVRGAKTTELEKVCCGGGCCLANTLAEDVDSKTRTPILTPDNEAFRTLQLNLGSLGLNSVLSKTIDLPLETVSLQPSLQESNPRQQINDRHPPDFVTPHPPYEVFSAKLHHARELTKLGAEKRTYHFDLDVTDYPTESGDVDFVVGGAIGIQAPNAAHLVDDIFGLLNIPKFVRDKPVLLKTNSGRWPTIWGDEMAREITTTRRELLTWCSDVQSYPPTKNLLRVLAEYATNSHEKKILLYLCSAQGQAAFCDLRTGPHITLTQLLNAFPSSQPPLPHLLTVLNTLMPRFYSLSQDPHVSCTRDDHQSRRLVEIAVTVHETPDWQGGTRTGLGSGYLERLARQVIDTERIGKDCESLDLRIPMFRGLMANPLAREFVTDGPMLLIGAGVGIAPFRGFVQRRLRSANCANKVWVLQGVRDSLLDELYSGEWGAEEDKVKKVVQSRRGESRYVQEEVRHQADLVWFIINALDGRVFVCGSSHGMGEGVEQALIDVAMDKGGLRREEAEQFWAKKKEGAQYIAETW